MHFRQAKGLLSAHNGMNIYRGCTHGCIYCDSRSKCYQINHDFEDIEVKINAPELLYEALRKKRRKCMVGTGAMCDPYMQCEDELKLTRKCLEIIDDLGFGIAIQTKSTSILRDLDIIKSINSKSKCVVQMTLTTYDEALCKIVEPKVSTTAERFEALKIFSENGIPTVVWFTPILPFINDTEENLRGIIDYCIKAKVYGILNFGISLTLREGDREYYYECLDKHFPGLRSLYHKKYGFAYELYSDNNDKLLKIFNDECRKNNIICNRDEIFRFMNEFPEKHENEQLSFF